MFAESVKAGRWLMGR
ncbi:hypothetical protein [Pantoea sp. PNA 03-3]|nr:hypothetical protein [Pantoea sp. PNA 03-3]